MTENSVVDFFTDIEWDDGVENLLSSWADIAACYCWLFDKAYRKYHKINFSFSLPIIILSTVAGTLIMSLDSLLPADQVHTGQVVLGGINIFTGILSTIQNYFNPSKESEVNLNASKGWNKFERNIKIQLTLARHSRKDVSEFLRECRTEYETLLENCPIIDETAIKLFKESFKDIDVVRPEVLDKIEKTIVNKFNKNIPLTDLIKLKQEISQKNDSKEKIKVDISVDRDYELNIVEIKSQED